MSQSLDPKLVPTVPSTKISGLLQELANPPKIDWGLGQGPVGGYVVDACVTPDGATIFAITLNPGNTTTYITRISRATLTRTHTTSLATGVGTVARGAKILICSASYVWLLRTTGAGGTVKVTRWNAADLTGETTLDITAGNATNGSMALNPADNTIYISHLATASSYPYVRTVSGATTPMVAGNAYTPFSDTTPSTLTLYHEGFLWHHNCNGKLRKLDPANLSAVAATITTTAYSPCALFVAGGKIVVGGMYGLSVHTPGGATVERGFGGSNSYEMRGWCQTGTTADDTYVIAGMVGTASVWEQKLVKFDLATLEPVVGPAVMSANTMAVVPFLKQGNLLYLIDQIFTQDAGVSINSSSSSWRVYTL